MGSVRAKVCPSTASMQHGAYCFTAGLQHGGKPVRADCSIPGPASTDTLQPSVAGRSGYPPPRSGTQQRRTIARNSVTDRCGPLPILPHRRNAIGIFASISPVTNLTLAQAGLLVSSDSSESSRANRSEFFIQCPRRRVDRELKNRSMKRELMKVTSLHHRY